MRFIIMCGLYLVFCSFGWLSYGHQDGVQESTPPHIHLVSDILWAKHLETFKERLTTQPEAARTELRNVANNLFNKHLLIDEWIPLYFRLSRNGTEHSSDVMRLSELEIRMLTDIDTKKYAAQIQNHQRILTELNRNPNLFHRYSHEEPTENPTIRDTRKNHQNKNEHLRTDAEAARTEFLKQATSRGYAEHPLLEKWVSLGVQLFTTDVSTLGDVITFVELQIQMLKDTAPETQKKMIQELGRSLEALNKLSKDRNRKIAGPIRAFIGLPDKSSNPKEE